MKKSMPSLKRIDFKRVVLDWLMVLISAMCYTVSISVFTKSFNFVPGGVTGLSLLINHFIPQLPVGLASLIINIPIIILCYKFFGKAYIIKSGIVMVIWALMLDIVGPLLPIYTDNPLMGSLFGGIFMGLALSLVYMRGFCTGGTDFIAMPLKKTFPHMSIGTLNLIIDGTIIVAGGIVFGAINSVLMGIIMTIASTTVTDKLMYGTQSGKRLVIVSDKGKQISNEIMNKIGRGVTILDSVGAYSGKHHDMLICSCSRAEVYRIRRICTDIDKNALIMVNSNDEVFGEGFKNPNE